MGGNRKIEDIVYSIGMVNLWVSANTDGILLKLYSESDLDKISGIIDEWSNRTGFKMSMDTYKRVFQKDVNNYIIEDENGKCKSKGSYVKKLSKLDYDLPVVNRAIFEFLINGVDPRVTIYKEDKLMEFQKIIKISSKYDFGFKENIMGNRIDVTNDKETRTYFGARINEKVNRCFATTDFNEGTILKKHGEKSFLDKVANVPDKCVIINTNVEEEKVPSWLDRDYYVTLAKSRVNDFIGKIF